MFNQKNKLKLIHYPDIVLKIHTEQKKVSKSYVFKTNIKYNKIDLKKYLSSQYKLSPIKINTNIVNRKKKSIFKKVYVTI